VAWNILQVHLQYGNAVRIARAVVVSWVLLTLVHTAAVLGQGQQAGCSSDSDCKLGRVCVAGVCSSPQAGPAPSVPAITPAAGGTQEGSPTNRPAGPPPGVLGPHGTPMVDPGAGLASGPLMVIPPGDPAPPPAGSVLPPDDACKYSLLDYPWWDLVCLLSSAFGLGGLVAWYVTVIPLALLVLFLLTRLVVARIKRRPLVWLASRAGEETLYSLSLAPRPPAETTPLDRDRVAKLCSALAALDSRLERHPRPSCVGRTVRQAPPLLVGMVRGGGLDPWFKALEANLPPGQRVFPHLREAAARERQPGWCPLRRAANWLKARLRPRPDQTPPAA
jgi:hypothetical protein